MSLVAGNKNVAWHHQTGGLFSLENRASVSNCMASVPDQEGEERLKSVFKYQALKIYPAFA